MNIYIEKKQIKLVGKRIRVTFNFCLSTDGRDNEKQQLREYLT